MDPTLLTTLLNKSESETLDFKEFTYKFANPATDDEKSELVKDILTFANAWKETDAYILIGVRENQQRMTAVPGVTTFLPDHSVQQFVNSKTNKPVRFHIESVAYQGVTLDVIRIDQAQERPFYLEQKFGRLDAKKVYVRRGSGMDVADIEEIARMGADNVRRSARVLPQLLAEWTRAGDKSGIGAAISVVSTKLVFAAPPPEEKRQGGLRSIIARETSQPDGRGRATDIARKMRSPIPGLFETVMTQPTRIEIVTHDPFAVKDEDLLNYAFDLHSHAPLSLRVQNTGTVNAEGVRVELRVPAVDGLRFYRQSDAPEKPRGGLMDLVAIERAGFDDVSVTREGADWLLTFDFETIQPKAIAWTREPFFVSARQTFSGECSGRIFADDLPDPVEFKLMLEVRAETKTFSPIDLDRLRVPEAEAGKT